ncbi:MAG: hypothetical protein IJ001_09295 [Oscillospiraceae bacterium]|nr:hypothetical protein [Oscillospiraceae bacterium]
MAENVYQRMVERSMEPEGRERTVSYLAEKLSSFVKKGERVLICFPEHWEGNLSWLFEQAAVRCGATPVLWGPDLRWKTLMQQAFYSRAATIIGPPLVVLGLSKLKRQNGIPLYIRRVVTAGYPCPDWMIDGIIKGLDCQVWGSFGLDTTGVVAGFSCGKSRGVHLRSGEFAVDIVDSDGKSLPPGEDGEMILYPIDRPELRYDLGERGRIETAPCRCGCASPRLMDMRPGKTVDPDLAELGQYLQSWTSVLDCRMRKGNYGLELELIVFAGEKLPKLPSAAKQVIRPWDPKHDEPLWYEPIVKNTDFSFESH